MLTVSLAEFRIRSLHSACGELRRVLNDVIKEAETGHGGEDEIKQIADRLTRDEDEILRLIRHTEKVGHDMSRAARILRNGREPEDPPAGTAAALAQEIGAGRPDLAALLEEGAQRAQDAVRWAWNALAAGKNEIEATRRLAALGTELINHQFDKRYAPVKRARERYLESANLARKGRK